MNYFDTFGLQTETFKTMFATASSLKPIEEVLDDTFKQVKSLVNGAQLLSAIKVLDATEAKIKKLPMLTSRELRH